MSAVSNVRADIVQNVVEPFRHLKGIVNGSSMDEVVHFLETYVPVIDNTKDLPENVPRTWVKATVLPIHRQTFQTNEDAWEFACMLDQTDRPVNTIYVGEVIHETSETPVYAYYIAF